MQFVQELALVVPEAYDLSESLLVLTKLVFFHLDKKFVELGLNLLVQKCGNSVPDLDGLASREKLFGLLLNNF